MDAVKATLKSWNLSQYADAFFEQGYDDLAYLKTLSEDMLQRVAAAVGMKPGHAGKFSMYMASIAAGIPVPGSTPAALQAPKPVAAPTSSAIVPHQCSLTQAIVLALEHGCTSRDDIVEFVAERSSSIKSN